MIKQILARLARMPDAESVVARMSPVSREPALHGRPQSELLVVGQYDGHALTFAKNPARYDASTGGYVDASTGEPLRDPVTHWALLREWSSIQGA